MVFRKGNGFEKDLRFSFCLDALNLHFCFQQLLVVICKDHLMCKFLNLNMGIIVERRIKSGLRAGTSECLPSVSPVARQTADTSDQEMIKNYLDELNVTIDLKIDQFQSITKTLIA